MATASPPGPSEPAIPMSELPPPPAAEASSSSPPDYAPPADADPKDYFHAPPDYSLPSYGNGGPAYHDIEPPDEPIPRYSEARAEAGAAGLPAPDASAHLVAGFARSFRSSRMVAVVTAAATMAMCLVGVINSRALRGGSGAGGLWTAVGVSAGDFVLSVPLLFPRFSTVPSEPGPVPLFVRYAVYEDTLAMAGYLAAALLSPYCYQGDTTCGIITIARFMSWICCLVHLWCLLVELRAKRSLSLMGHWK